jgi:hypothetical protein
MTGGLRWVASTQEAADRGCFWASGVASQARRLKACAEALRLPKVTLSGCPHELLSRDIAMDRLIPVNEPNKPEDRVSIVIPCAPKDFGNFISGLLGQGQVIEGCVAGSFVVHHDDIENLFLILTERVAQQNGGTLVQYSLRIGYDDDSSVVYSSLDEFRDYAEIKKKASVSYHAK